MQDVFGQTLAVGDEVAIRVRSDLHRGRIIRFPKVQATVEYAWSGLTLKRSINRLDIIKMVEGDHKPEASQLTAPVAAPAIPTFVYSPDAVDAD